MVELLKDRKNAQSVHIHLWDGQNIVAEVGTTDTVTARYLRGINLIAREQDGVNQYYLFNAHGDVVQRYDALGNLLKNYKYDAFGNEENPEPLDSNPFRYCGEYFDEETGKIYLRARYYDPATGRFGAEDPARHGLNWYTYCGGNLIARIDPTGHYDREVAVAYAVQYGEKWKYNPAYMMMDQPLYMIDYFLYYGTYTGGADCTSFTSQALSAGGLKMNDDWHYRRSANTRNNLINAFITPEGKITAQPYRHDFTAVWVGANSQFKYFSDEENGYSDKTFTIDATSKEIDIASAIKQGVRPGDLLYWDWDVTAKEHHVSHASMISKIDKDGRLYYAAHTNHRRYGKVLDVWEHSSSPLQSVRIILAPLPPVLHWNFAQVSCII